MQDCLMHEVFIFFWREDRSVDIELKLADVCAADFEDHTSCVDAMDIKVSREKAPILFNLTFSP